MKKNRDTASNFFITTLILFCFSFLSFPSYSFNLFPVIDSAVLDVEEIILKTFDLTVGEPIPEAELKKVTRHILKSFASSDTLYLVISVKTDPIGNKQENRKMGIHLANWVGQVLTASGVPPSRIAITEPTEDKSYFSGPYMAFRKMQKCKIVLVEGSDILKYFDLAQMKNKPGAGGFNITILSPLVRETDKGFHILKGLVDPLVTILAVTVNNSTKTISVFDGKFETPISLSPGHNTISVSGRGPGTLYASASFNIRYLPPKPTIVIEKPDDGEYVDISRSPTLVVKGRVKSKENIISAFLIHNEFVRNLKIHEDGSFSQRAVLLSDEDTFRVEAVDSEGFAGVSNEHRVSSYGISRQHITVILNWQTDEVDLDLIVKDMYGNWTSFESPDRFRSHRSIPEGRLEIDDKDGFGPEIFNITETRENSYDILIKYYYGKKETTAYVTIILFPGIPPKKIVKTFGPIEVAPSSDETFITRIKMPEGLFQQLSQHAEVNE